MRSLAVINKKLTCASLRRRMFNPTLLVVWTAKGMAACLHNILSAKVIMKIINVTCKALFLTQSRAVLIHCLIYRHNAEFPSVCHSLKFILFPESDQKPKSISSKIHIKLIKVLKTYLYN